MINLMNGQVEYSKSWVSPFIVEKAEKLTKQKEKGWDRIAFKAPHYLVEQLQR